MQKRIIPALLVAALLVSGLVSILSIHRLQGSARVINYAGVVRGGTQRLVKQELSGVPDDALIARLDALLRELRTGEGEEGLTRLEDRHFQALLSEMDGDWAALKGEIARVRGGGDKERLFVLSEDYFELADRTVHAAEAFTAANVDRAELVIAALVCVVTAAAGVLIWYGGVQDRRRLLLLEEERENEVRREYLKRMSEALRAPMNDISELMYIADQETYELLFINEAGKRTFQVDDVEGRKCYKVLQGLDEPCPFCNNRLLKPGEIHTWEHTNTRTGKHYLLKDRLVEWDGRTARMEIAFDMTEVEARKQELQQALESERILMEWVRSLYEEGDVNQAMPRMLEQVGRFVQASRVYILVNHGGRVHIDFEWCSSGTQSRAADFQGQSASAIERWSAFQERRTAMVVKDLEEIRELAPAEYEIFRGCGVEGMVVAPLEQEDRLIGCLVVENPPPERAESVAGLLQALCYYLLLAWRRAESEQALSRLSYYDTLTNFYNRNRFMEDTRALEGEGGPVGVVYLDINGLKDINDRGGHAEGDRALVRCAQIISTSFREGGFYRIGGDEFVILCPGADRETFQDQARELRRRFREGAEYRAAIGVRWVKEFQDIHKVVAEADAAMYEDKKGFYRGRLAASNRYRHESDEILRLAEPGVLRRELDQGRFQVYLQPKATLAGREVAGAEALVRYCPSPDTLMPPDSFLPLLESRDLIREIDFYVFEFVCARMKAWAEEGGETGRVSVNFSRNSLAQASLVEELLGLCGRYGVPPQGIEIEITETIGAVEALDLNDLIARLRRAGFPVSIDDFGARYSNLSLLTTVEFDVLKLDRSIVTGLDTSPRGRAVVESVASTCNKLGIQMVAEGVETEGEAQALLACGVKYMQGYLFSCPVPVEEYERKYRRRG